MKMDKWKLQRQKFGNEEFTFYEGQEVTVGRGVNNTITLSSIVVSRNHCVINVQKDKVLITDLKSSNGIYVGLKKIPQNVPYTLEDSDIIGFGWTLGAPVSNINDKEKYMFKLVKDKSSPSVADRILFQQSDNEVDDIEEQIAAIDSKKPTEEPRNTQSPVLQSQQQLKRKLEDVKIKQEHKEVQIIIDNQDVINISDSENEVPLNHQNGNKKPRLEPDIQEQEKQTIPYETLKTEKDDLEYEAFNVKQEYMGYDDEAIQCDSDSDSESEQWLLRLSQSSPGKTFIKIPRENKVSIKEESSYSQLEDYVDEDDNVEEYEDNLISIPHVPPEVPEETATDKVNSEQEVNNQKQGNDDKVDLYSDKNSFQKVKDNKNEQSSKIENEITRDEVDGGIHISTEIATSSVVVNENLNEKVKRTQIIEPLVLQTRKKLIASESKLKSPLSKPKSKKQTSSKKHDITNSQKEERKKKLKEIANKEKEECEKSKTNSSGLSKVEKAVASAKVTTSNRGAFLTDVVQGIVKPIKRKDSPKSSGTSKDKIKETQSKESNNSLDSIHRESIDGDIENKKRQSEAAKKDKKSKRKYKQKETQDDKKSFKSTHSKPTTTSSEFRVPLKSLKPMTESEESYSGKPFSKVEPLPPKKKKQVRFSEVGPQVHIFEIPEGNKMKKTSLVKTTLVGLQKTPVFSLKKITLIKILRWNPHWLDEQMNNNEPPPILGHSSPPMTILHSFNCHNQYVQVVGDLLLMEIWECLTQGYMRQRSVHYPGLAMRIASLPPIPSNVPQERCFELFNMSVDVSLPNNELRNVPRVGEVMIIAFGPADARTRRFFFVHNVRCLPSPPNNIHSFFNISLHACFTDKMRSLKPGELMIGVSIAYINKELLLFEAMEYLAGSPLSDAILRPEPRHFVKFDPKQGNNNTQWTKALNPSQQVAVNSSVSAALGDRPCIQMVQGPPGTGKSSVICAMVMSFFYDSHGRKQNRGMVLICATSNAAVDELVIRLLNIRQSLPKTERFRMVRVGRAEAMHPRARDVSSQQLAQRDAAARLQNHNATPGLAEEISHLEAKINMWKTQAQNAKDPVRVAYCQKNAAQIASRIALLRSNGGGGGDGKEIHAEHLGQVERRIIEGAHIVVTTLASAQNAKMKVLKGRVALCIVDEAGQAIEPETLIPLTLDVTRMTLIGDPQQLPGFICSQRAKKHGLGESLFSRLTSSAEHWSEGNPVVLLNQQYRMHPEIADYPNRAFYNGQITTMSADRPDVGIAPYSIVSISSGDKGQGASGANDMEAWGVSRLVIALFAKVRPLNLSLAVITPYNAHKDLIKKYLRMLQDPTEPQIEVNTVDSFQGQERDVMVVSLARSQGVGFLTDAGRMNVMLTRARHALLVCLNPHAMLKNHQWRTLVEDAQRRNLYRVLPNKMCQAMTSSQTQHDDILKYIAYTKPKK